MRAIIIILILCACAVSFTIGICVLLKWIIRGLLEELGHD